jgi:cysteinyl-tRNA synthetase
MNGRPASEAGTSMELKLYDTLTREKRLFRPLDAANVRMYVCGPTVYDFAHIGNARPLIVFDVLFRLLRHLYGSEHVKYVRNVTDVDDKINARAAERLAARGEVGGDLNAEVRALTDETYRNFQADVAALGCLPPTVEPRATEYIRRADGKIDMVTLIERLISNGNAYEADGHVLFSVASMPDYGRLSKRPLDEMIAGARVEVAPYKRDPMDFVLWKPSKPVEPGWDSPWGCGRPGWHIECSAMSAALLGETFDIHGGGIDLVFPHHENEIAQSRCAFHTPIMAQHWMHNGFLQVEGEKMAKSAGNFVTIRELLGSQTFGGRTWGGPVLRLAMLRTHYRQPIDWTLDNLRRAEQTLERWRAFSGERTTKRYDRDLFGRFMELLTDDLNTPGALGVIDELVATDSTSPEHRYFVYVALKLLGFKSPLSPTKRASNAITTALKALESLPDEYLRAVAKKGSTNPRYGNGKFRPEGSLILGFGLLEQLAVSRGIRADLNEQDAAEYSRTIGIHDTYKISKLIAARDTARKEKNFAESDRIRDELAAMGVVLKDSKDGTTWEVAR